MISRTTELSQLAEAYILSHFGPDDGGQLLQSIAQISKDELRFQMTESIIRDLESIRKTGSLDVHNVRKAVGGFIAEPVSVQTFVEDRYFLDAKNVLYPAVMDAMIEINSGEYEEAVLTGGIGTGKSTLALYTTAYQLYVLSCYADPHTAFTLDPASEIMFIFQSINAKLAKAVDYDRFKSMVEKSPYFMEEFPYDKGILSELKFPKRVIVKPISGQETGAIGQNVIGGLIDEMNFMANIEKSKSNRDGAYDQATALYTSIARRRQSRFMAGGRLPGLLCLVSSKKYPGQFTDKKEEEALRQIDKTGKSNIYVYDKRVWDVKPEGTFCGTKFRLFIGDKTKKPRILVDGEDESSMPEDKIIDVPTEYLSAFEDDMMGSLRDVAGVSTIATHPFIMDTDSITAAVRTDKIMFSREIVDFVTTSLDISVKEMHRKELPRFVHIDLAVTGDTAGVVIGAVTGFKSVAVAGGAEMMPEIWIDGMLGVKPPVNGEILFYKIRELLYALTDAGMNIKWVTFDQFQSVDSMQLLRQKGYSVGRQSVDITTAPYDFVKTALYQGRLSMPPHEKCQYELATLEKDAKKNKIDHPAHSSKDISDALAGVVYGLTMRKATWIQHGIPLGKIPSSIMDRLKEESKPQTNT